MLTGVPPRRERFARRRTACAQDSREAASRWGSVGHDACLVAAVRAVRLSLSLSIASACAPPSGQPSSQATDAAAAPTGVVRIHDSPKLTSIEVPGRTDSRGAPLRIACVTCHSVRDAGAATPFPSQAADLREFHVGLVVQHGTLACTACHVDRAGGEPLLHLADGASIPTSEAMRLCGQCHGQKRALYDRGAHGGMTGYWDLSRGDRSKNHCVDCHDPHFPAFQPSRPVLPPRDRGVTGGGPHG